MTGESVDLSLRNVGAGAAINVSVERSEDQRLRFEPEHIPVLQKEEQVWLTMRPAEGDYRPDTNLILDDGSISLKMVARYLDVEGRGFRTSTMVGGGAKPPFINDARTFKIITALRKRFTPRSS